MACDQPRIAMLSVHSCPVGNLGAKDTGGMSVYVREVAREMGKQGISVDAYTRVHDPKDDQVYRLGQNARLIHLKAGEDRDINKLAVYPHLPDFASNVEDFRRHNRLHYDLVFSHYWLSGRVGQYLQHWWHVPHLTMFHTLGAVKNAIGIGEVESGLRIGTERYLARNCHRIIASTEAEREDLIRYYGAPTERIGVIPCGVNLGLFQLVDKETARKRLGFGDERIILFVGRIAPLKGVDQLLRAMPYVRNGHQLRLVIIGGDEGSQHEIERLQRLSRQLDIQRTVVFPGLVRQEELPYFYSVADACVVPSYYESFGLVALESMACGTPVVATSVGELKNIIRQGETGYVVRDNTPGALADRISRLISEPGLNAESSASIRESVVRFDWSNIAQAVIRECSSVLCNV